MTNFAVLGAAFAAAHVAGTRRQEAEGGETVEIVKGVSAQRDVLGQNVYDAEGQVVGKIEDLILTKKIVSYAIVGVGGFLGLGRHDVAIPVGELDARRGQDRPARRHKGSDPGHAPLRVHDDGGAGMSSAPAPDLSGHR